MSCVLVVQAQTHLSGKYFIKNYTPLEYNAEAQNWDFVQDSSGLLYVANTAGVLIFDGNRWQKINMPKNAVPLTLTKDDQGKVFVGGTDFMGYLEQDDQGFAYVKIVHDRLPKDTVIDVIWSCQFHDGLVYFNNKDQLFIWDGAEIEVIDYPGKGHQLIVHDKSLYLPSSEGMFQLVSTNLIKVGDKSFPNGIRSILHLKGDTSLILSYEDGLRYWIKDEIFEIDDHKLNDFFSKHLVYSAVSFSDGNIAVATKTAGILIMDNELSPLYRLDEISGLQNSDVKKLFIDFSGNLWSGNNRGMSYLEYPIQSTYFDVIEEGIYTIEDISIFKDDLYVGTINGTYRIDGDYNLLEENFTSNITMVPLSNWENFALCNLSDRLLFGGVDQISAFDGQESKILTSNITPRKILQSELNPKVVYIGHLNGVVIWIMDGERLTREIHLDIPPIEYRGIAETADGNLWLSTIVNGVYYIELNDKQEQVTSEHFDENDGLPSTRDILVYRVDQNVFFTTYDGVYEFDSSRMRFQKSEAFGGQNEGNTLIYSFGASPNRDNIWMNAIHSRRTWHYRFDGENYIPVRNNYASLNEYQMYKILANDDGSAWLGGAEVLAFVKEQKDENKDAGQMKTIIRSVVVEDDSVVYGGTGELTKDMRNYDLTNRSIRFEVSSFAFGYNEKHQYQYRLIGQDDNWSSWGDEPFRVYTNLSAGDYQFEARAQSEKGSVSKVASYSFSIQPYWYETWWFKSILGLIALWSIYQSVLFFSRRRFIKKVEQLEMVLKLEKEKDEAIIAEKEKGISAMIEAQEQERQRIAKDLHDGIVQEIGSNIIRWRNLFSTKEQSSKKADELIASLENANTELRALSHQMMPKALETVGVVSATGEMLDRSLEGSGIAYEFEHFGIEERLPQKVEIPLYRIAQELIQNTIKHSQASQVNVQLYKVGQDVNLIVEDNGVGLDESDKGEGIGLQNVRSRLAPLGGTINIEPSPENGTLVTVKIPL